MQDEGVIVFYGNESALLTMQDAELPTAGGSQVPGGDLPYLLGMKSSGGIDSRCQQPHATDGMLALLKRLESMRRRCHK